MRQQGRPCDEGLKSIKVGHNGQPSATGTVSEGPSPPGVRDAGEQSLRGLSSRHGPAPARQLQKLATKGPARDRRECTHASSPSAGLPDGAESSAPAAVTSQRRVASCSFVAGGTNNRRPVALRRKLCAYHPLLKLQRSSWTRCTLMRDGAESRQVAYRRRTACRNAAIISVLNEKCAC